MPGQMGNSEVGHNALGSGQIIPQGIAQIEAAFSTGDIWLSKAWLGAMKFLQNPSRPKTALAEAAAYWRKQSGKMPAKTLHFAGIFSDGGVHSDIKYLEQMVQKAYAEGIRKIRFHCIFDGRDVAPQSEPKYINRLEKFCAQFRDADFRIASGGGRMVMTADRYENDWSMVKLGYDAMVFGVAPHKFHSANEAIATFRREDPCIQDQYLPAFVVVDETDEQKPIGRIQDGDALIYYDFRADRAIEITEAFVEKTFTKFNRVKPAGKNFKTQKVPEENPAPAIYFAGLTEYNQDRHLPKNILVPPIKIENTLNTFLGYHKISQFAISETAKFGHITYYFNGNSYKKAAGEHHHEVISYTEPFNTRPWMRSAEITDIALSELANYQFVRINYPGGDMVGHFAELGPTIVAMEAIDLQLARLAKAVDSLGGMMIVTADHGNAEELLDRNGNPKTAHTTNPVPCIFYDNTKNRKLYKPAKLQGPGLSNLAATISLLLGLDPFAGWQKPLLKLVAKK